MDILDGISFKFEQKKFSTILSLLHHFRLSSRMFPYGKLMGLLVYWLVVMFSRI